MYYVGNVSAEARRLCEITKACMEAGIAQCRPGAPVRNIGKVLPCGCCSSTAGSKPGNTACACAALCLSRGAASSRGRLSLCICVLLLKSESSQRVACLCRQ